MINILKMDLYKLIHTVSFWIMVFAVILISYFPISASIFSCDYEYEMVVQEENNLEENKTEENSIEEIDNSTNSEKSNIDERVPFSTIINLVFTTQFTLAICVIFIPLFVHDERKSGYIKNISGQLTNRGILVISKLIIAAIQVFVVLIGVVICGLIICGLFFRDRVIIGINNEMLEYLALQYLLHFSLSAVTIMLTIIFKNAGAGIGFGIFIVSGLVYIYYSSVDDIVKAMGFKKFHIDIYTIEGNIQALTVGAGQGEIIRSLLVGLAYLILSILVSIKVMQKRDI